MTDAKIDTNKPDSNKPIDIDNVKTYSIYDRKSLVNIDNFAISGKKNQSFSNFLDSLPSILAGNDLRNIISAISKAALNKKKICFGMGGHVIKVGLNPVLIDLMEKKVITMIAMNGAGIIHDLEIAMTGKTSEDVAASLDQGQFGMAKETSEFLNIAINNADKESKGLGRAVGELINKENLPFKENSLLAQGSALNIPVTVHVAIGTDIIHMHPGFNAAACGKASHHDFKVFASNIADLEQGVFINAGSAVILPEVFLKALTLVRNLSYSPSNFTTVNLDFIRHYRPMTNVVNRPTQSGGKGYSLVGHHEILIPLIAAG
ncbi:MAG: deoxyhypusine synthase family protein, partial [Desulfobacteraceae bacterium]|nr:deoxyhypusine synthase family protein [Desulfobacteraceae bacterium]